MIKGIKPKTRAAAKGVIMNKDLQNLEITLSDLGIENTNEVTLMFKYIKRKYPDIKITLRCNVLWDYVKNTSIMQYIDYLIINHAVKLVSINDDETIDVKESLDTGLKVLKK